MAKSLARQALDSALVIVESLAILERAYADPPRSQDTHIVEGLRAACSILMVAAFEEFVKQCFINELGKLSRVPINFTRLPEKFRVSSTFKQLELALGGKGTKISRLNDIKASAGRVHNDQIWPEAFAKTAGNPNSETVSEMFKDIGFQSFFDSSRARFNKQWGSPVSQNFAKDKLDEILSRRHQIAHSGRALNVSRVDLKENLRFIKRFSTVIEMELRIHVTGMAKIAKT